MDAHVAQWRTYTRQLEQTLNANRAIVAAYIEKAKGIMAPEDQQAEVNKLMAAEYGHVVDEMSATMRNEAEQQLQVGGVAAASGQANDVVLQQPNVAPALQAKVRYRRLTCAPPAPTRHTPRARARAPADYRGAAEPGVAPPGAGCF